MKRHLQMKNNKIINNYIDQKDWHYVELGGSLQDSSWCKMFFMKGTF